MTLDGGTPADHRRNHQRRAGHARDRRRDDRQWRLCRPVFRPDHRPRRIDRDRRRDRHAGGRQQLYRRHDDRGGHAAAWQWRNDRQHRRRCRQQWHAGVRSLEYPGVRRRRSAARARWSSRAPARRRSPAPAAMPDRPASNGGRLLVDGTIRGPVDVASGARLGGTGTHRRDGDHRRRRTPCTGRQPRHADRRLAVAEPRLAARLRARPARHCRRRDQRPDHRQRRAHARRHAQPRRCRRASAAASTGSSTTAARSPTMASLLGGLPTRFVRQRHADLDRNARRGQSDRQHRRLRAAVLGWRQHRRQRHHRRRQRNLEQRRDQLDRARRQPSTHPGKAALRCSREPRAR